MYLGGLLIGEITQEDLLKVDIVRARILKRYLIGCPLSNREKNYFRESMDMSLEEFAKKHGKEVKKFLKTVNPNYMSKLEWQYITTTNEDIYFVNRTPKGYEFEKIEREYDNTMEM